MARPSAPAARRERIERHPIAQPRQLPCRPFPCRSANTLEVFIDDRGPHGVTKRVDGRAEAVQQPING